MMANSKRSLEESREVFERHGRSWTRMREERATACPASTNGHAPYWTPQGEHRCWDCGAELSDDKRDPNVCPKTYTQKHVPAIFGEQAKCLACGIRLYPKDGGSNGEG